MEASLPANYFQVTISYKLSMKAFLKQTLSEETLIAFHHSSE